MNIVTEIIQSDKAESARVASEVLNNEGVIVYPTETLYGIGVCALDYAAVEKVFEIKGRPKNMPIPVLIKDLSMLEGIVEMNDAALKLSEAFWPGALTIIVKETGVLPEIITAGTGKVAVRISSQPFVKSLFEQFDKPLTSTSANLSGGGNLSNFEDIKKGFEGRVDLIIDSGNIPASKGSTIVDTTVNPPNFVRYGDIEEEKIKEYL